VSLLGMSFASTLFGMSQTLWQTIVFRCVAGVFGGTIVTVRAMVSENSTKHTQARAFSFFAFAYNMGIFIGPLIGIFFNYYHIQVPHTNHVTLGGALERPASKFPSTFGKVRFWHDYPYALPNIVVSAIALSAATTTMLFVRETLHIHRDNKNTAGPTMSTWEIIKHPGVTPVLVVYNYVMMMASTFTAVFPVHQYTPVGLGGLGFSPGLIAACTALNGSSQAAWLLLIFPVLHKRVGTGRVLWLCAVAWPVLFAAAPLYNVLLRYELTTLFWSTGPLVVVLFSGVSMAFSELFLAMFTL
jgi:MFS family permease